MPEVCDVEQANGHVQVQCGRWSIGVDTRMTQPVSLAPPGSSSSSSPSGRNKPQSPHRETMPYPHQRSGFSGESTNAGGCSGVEGGASAPPTYTPPVFGGRGPGAGGVLGSTAPLSKALRLSVEQGRPRRGHGYEEEEEGEHEYEEEEEGEEYGYEEEEEDYPYDSAYDIEDGRGKKSRGASTTAWGSIKRAMGLEVGAAGTGNPIPFLLFVIFVLILTIASLLLIGCFLSGNGGNGGDGVCDGNGTCHNGSGVSPTTIYPPSPTPYSPYSPPHYQGGVPYYRAALLSALKALVPGQRPSLVSVKQGGGGVEDLLGGIISGIDWFDWARYISAGLLLSTLGACAAGSGILFAVWILVWPGGVLRQSGPNGRTTSSRSPFGPRSGGYGETEGGSRSGYGGGRRHKSRRTSYAQLSTTQWLYVALFEWPLSLVSPQKGFGVGLPEAGPIASIDYFTPLQIGWLAIFNLAQLIITLALIVLLLAELCC